MRVKFVHEKGQNPTRVQVGAVLQDNFNTAVKEAYVKLKERRQKEATQDKELGDMFLDFGDED
jgi:hypothetical protein